MQSAALMSPGLAGSGGAQVAVQTDDGLEVGAAARQLQHVAAAEAEADRGLARQIADAAFVACRAQRVERSRDAAAALGRIGAQAVGEFRGLGGPALILPPPYMSATKATYLLPAISAARLMASPVTPSQFGAISSSGRRSPTLVVVDQRAVARRVAGAIFDAFDCHASSLCPVSRE